MTIISFEYLPVDVLFEIFAYLSPVDIVRAFVSLNKHFSTILLHQYLWHIHVGNNSTSFLIFNDLCQNVLRLVGARLISLRITLSYAVGGWSLVSSSLNSHQITLLRHLHLIDITPHEFDKLLRHRLMKQLHTLLIDVTDFGSFGRQVVQGAYLAKVCSQLPALRTCRLPFDLHWVKQKKLSQNSTPPLITLPDISSTTYLHTLTIGINTSRFLERLLSCIPSIQNLSVGVEDPRISEEVFFGLIPMPVAVDIRLLPRLSRLHINCVNELSFHRSVVLLSSVFTQLSYLSLKLEAYMRSSDPYMISGDTIQQLCIDRLQPLATCILDLSIRVMKDFEEKRILNSFYKAPFTRRARPKVLIHEQNSCYAEADNYYFIVYTVPYNKSKLSWRLFSEDLQRSSQISLKTRHLFPLAKQLEINGFEEETFLSDLINRESCLSSSIPWSLLTKIVIGITEFDITAELEAILRMAHNVHTLVIHDRNSIVLPAIFHNTNDLGTRVHEQIQSIMIADYILTLDTAQDFCMFISKQLPNMKNVAFTIIDRDTKWRWKPSEIDDGENKSTERILKLVHYLVDHLQQLVSFRIMFFCWNMVDTPCFPHLIRRQLHQCPLKKPYRLRCSSEMIHIWL